MVCVGRHGISSTVRLIGDERPILIALQGVCMTRAKVLVLITRACGAELHEQLPSAISSWVFFTTDPLPKPWAATHLVWTGGRLQKASPERTGVRAASAVLVAQP